MAQVGTKEKTGRNTIENTSGSRKARNWCFTLNNYMDSEIKNLQSDEYQYVFQEETGENKTPHLQGLICFKNAVHLGGLKKLNSRAHWEICRNKIASMQYCSKEETRTGQIFTNMDFSIIQNFGTARHSKKSNRENSTSKKFDVPTFEEFWNEIKNDVSKDIENEIFKYMYNTKLTCVGENLKKDLEKKK